MHWFTVGVAARVTESGKPWQEGAIYGTVHPRRLCAGFCAALSDDRGISRGKRMYFEFSIAHSLVLQRFDTIHNISHIWSFAAEM